MDALARLGDSAAGWARRIVPDPFVIAIILAVVTLGLGSVAGSQGILDLCASMASGMLEPGLLAFGFQMALILVTGHALASSRSVKGILNRLAAIPRTTSQAASLVAFTAMVLALLNWGLGLVGGAFFAREVGRSFRKRGLELNYSLVGAAGYMGLLIWHGGLSGSAPLKVAIDGPFGPALDVSETLFSPLNVTVAGFLLLVIPLLFGSLGGSRAKAPETRARADRDEEESSGETSSGIPGWLDQSILISACVFVPMAVFLIAQLRANGTGAVNLNFIIIAFWFAGLVLHRGPMAYARAFGSGAKEAAGILLQFPLYFGILAAARDSGLLTIIARSFAEWSVSIQDFVSPHVSAPIATFLSSALVNLFVPSGGGQWVLQSPIIQESIQLLGVDRAKMVMAFSYGDEITNMLQPFWALPLLSITGLKARDVMGYTILAMFAAFPVFLICLAVFTPAGA